MDLSFLPKAQQRTVWMLLAALALLGGGWKLRDVVGNAQAAEARVNRLERSITRMDRNLVRLATKLNVEYETEVDEDVAAARVGP